MASRHRFLQRSINHVTFHNRLTEEETMWRQHEHEQQKDHSHRRDRSRSPRRKTHKRRSSSSYVDERKEQVINNHQIEAEFGPPLPTNLGVNADRWDHALFMQRYPKDYEKQINKSKRRESTSSNNSSRSSENEKKKKKHSKHDRKRKRKEEHKKKTKRRHRSRS